MQTQPLTQSTYKAASDLLFSLDLDTREEINHHLDEMEKYYVALDEDKVVGVIGWYQDDLNYANEAMGDKFPGTDVYWVGFFGVDKDKQGHGIGTELIKFLEGELKKKNANELWVSSVIESTSYYEKVGFTKVISGNISDRPHDFLVKKF